MRYLRVVGEPPAEAVPEAFRIVADSEIVEEARLLDWNLGSTESITALYAVDGDCRAAHEALSDATGVADASASVHREADADAGGRGYLLVTLDEAASPLIRRVSTLLSTPGLVVMKPVVYRDGRVRGRLVGEDDVLQAVVEGLPDRVETDVREIGPTGSVPLPEARADSLTDRQRAAVEAALELGYYDHPRQATHEDVADRLGCAPSTASEHLQKAEARLVRAALAFDP